MRKSCEVEDRRRKERKKKRIRNRKKRKGKSHHKRIQRGGEETDNKRVPLFTPGQNAFEVLAATRSHAGEGGANPGQMRSDIICNYAILVDMMLCYFWCRPRALTRLPCM